MGSFFTIELKYGMKPAMKQLIFQFRFGLIMLMILLVVSGGHMLDYKERSDTLDTGKELPQ